MNKKFPTWRKGQRQTATSLNDLQRTVEGLDVMRMGDGGGNGISCGVFAASRKPVPFRLKLVRLTRPGGPEDSSDFRNMSGVVQYWSSAADDFEDSNEELDNIIDPYNLVYDDDDFVVVYPHGQSGKHIIIPQMTVRHAITVAPDSGTYPTSSTSPDTYPIKFVRLSYTESPGLQGHTLSYLAPSDPGPDDFVHNIAGASGNYIPEGTLIWCYFVTGQWFTFIGEGEEESSSISISESASSSSESSSASSSSLSSLSSQSSSSQSSSSQSSSQSISEPMDCVDVVTRLEFDDETCILHVYTKEICFPISLGVMIGAEQEAGA